MNERDLSPFQSPPRCGLCQHTIRDGETFEDRMWEGNSGTMLGVAHTSPCPDLQPVPCAPCLSLILDEKADEPHSCELVTNVGIDAGRFIVGREQHCLCPCQARASAKESDALRAARAAAREVSGGEQCQE